MVCSGCYGTPHIASLISTPFKAGPESSTQFSVRGGAWTWGPAASRYQARGRVHSGSSLEFKGAKA